MLIFFIIVGSLGLIGATIGVIAAWDDGQNSSTFWPLLAWGFFFGLTTYSLNLSDKLPPKTHQQLIKIEYTRCLNSYNPETVLKEIKTSREKLCLETTEMYHQNILSLTQRNK